MSTDRRTIGNGITCAMLILGLFTGGSYAFDENEGRIDKDASESPLTRELNQVGEAVVDELKKAAAATEEMPKPDFPLAIRISSQVFDRRINRDINRTTSVDRVLFGTHARGTAVTTGKYKVTIIPSGDRALFLMSLKGSSVSKTVGTHDPVIIDTTTTTNFTARKLVAYDPDYGFYPGATEITSKTHSVTDNVRTNRTLGRRIILRQAHQQIESLKPRSNEIVRRDTEAEVRAKFDQAVDERLAELNKEFDVKRIAIYMQRECRVCSTEKHVVLHFGTGGELPELPAQETKALIELCVHKSVVGGQIVNAIEKFDAVKDLLTVFQVPLRSPMPLTKTQPANWVPGVDNLDDWIAIDLGQQGFAKMVKK